MEKKKIRKMALILALSRILSGSMISDAKADSNRRSYYILDSNGLITVVDDIRAVASNGRTIVNDDENITIFNRNNTFSKQYGASQDSLYKDFSNLIKNPYIWNSLQKCFPIDDFSSYEEAIFFYKLYFNTIRKCGCGYAVVADSVFHFFSGKEKEFEETFGYPMYVINSDGAIDFNYEYFILDFFNYSVLYPNYSEERKEIVKNMYARTLAKYELDSFLKSDEYNIEKKDWHELKDDELFDYIDKYQNKENKYEELYNKWASAKNKYSTLALALDEGFGYIKEYLKQYGIDARIKVQMKSDKKYETGDIIASVHFDLYKEDKLGKYLEVNDINAHYVFVVGADKNGKLIVSSWGDRFVFDDDDAYQTSKIVLKLSR